MKSGGCIIYEAVESADSLFQQEGTTDLEAAFAMFAAH